MLKEKKIFRLIRESVRKVEPDAEIILYGSFARGENRENSDIDLLILVDKDDLDYRTKRKIKYPLYDIEIDTGQIISPLVFSKNTWETKHHQTPLYENITREGVRL